MNNIWALIFENADVFEIEGVKAKPKPNFENILMRYRGNNFMHKVMDSVWCMCFFNVGDRDMMYNEMVNCGFRCFKIEEPQATTETPESIRRKGELQKKKLDKEIKKVQKLAKKNGVEFGGWNE